MKLAILGAGAWGSALAIALSENHAITLWGRDRKLLEEIARARANQRYLPGYALPAQIQCAADFHAAVAGADLALIATPVAGLRETAAKLAHARPALPVIWAGKGFETGSAKLPHQIAADVLAPEVARGVLSGPSFAQEVAAGKPTALTLAASDAQFARATARALNSARLRVYSSQDVLGVELGGAVKNVIAIAAGISDGMELGHNARAALITRGLAEMSRLALKLGARSETLMGLTGLGDLLLTCTGDLSRNRRVGLQLGQGDPLALILSRLGHVAEGVTTAREVWRRAQEMNLAMPITECVHRILYEGLAPAHALAELMQREPRPELDEN